MLNNFTFEFLSLAAVLDTTLREIPRRCCASAGSTMATAPGSDWPGDCVVGGSASARLGPSCYCFAPSA